MALMPAAADSTPVPPCRPPVVGERLSSRRCERSSPGNAEASPLLPIAVDSQVQEQVQYSSGTNGLGGTGWTIPPIRTQLSGLLYASWTVGDCLLSGRPQVRVLPGAR